MPSVPLTVRACLLASEDAAGLWREMLAVAADEMRVVLDAEQIHVLVAERKELVRALDEAREFDRG